MEFGYPMKSEFVAFARGTEFVATAPEGQAGLRWRAKYGFAGLNQQAVPTALVDGMNEQGLVVGLLYMPRFAKFESPTKSQYEKTLSPWEVSNFLLSSSASVKEARRAIESVFVAAVATPGFSGFVVPLHYFVADKSGACIVIEYIDGKRIIYDNPVGVLTNSPSFGWHLSNLSNYVGLSASNADDLKLGRFTVKGFGQGSGLLGLPGDYTPPSRFVRAAFFSQLAQKPAKGSDAVNLGFHILNTFDIFEGIIHEPAPAKGQEEFADITQWVVAYDQTNRLFYYRGYDGLKIKMIDLRKIDFASAGFKKVGLMETFAPEDITSQLTPFYPIVYKDNEGP